MFCGTVFCSKSKGFNKKKQKTKKQVLVMHPKHNKQFNFINSKIRITLSFEFVAGNA